MRYIYSHVYRSIIYNLQKMEQPKCLSVDEWIKNIWYIFRMEYYSAINKRDILTFETTWMGLEHIMLNKSKKDKYCMILL